MKNTTRFKQLLNSPEIVMIPAVTDALGAKLAERAGFEAVFLSGYAASASLLGAPDVGLLTLTEMYSPTAITVTATPRMSSER
jgi:2,3-dimethylmalate lyase